MRHDKAATLLELGRHLAASAEGLTLDEMAAVSSVGRRTAERLRDALWVLFPQMEELADDVYKRYRIPGGLDGLFQAPTTAELLELSKAADALRASGAAPRADALSSLERKVRAAMRSAALRRLVPDIDALVRAETIAVQAGPRPFEDEATIALIRNAIMSLQAVRFCYLGGSRRGEPRDVTPYGLMFGRANYLVAAELGSTEVRNYRLDRIEDLELLNLPAAAPADFSLSDYANRSFGVYQGDVHDVVLRVLPHKADEAASWRFHPTQQLERRPDGSVVVSFRASGMLELSWHLFTWADGIEIIAPEELRMTMVGGLRAALAKHSHTSDFDVQSA